MKLLLQSGRWVGVMVHRRPDSGSKKKKKFREGCQIVHEISLDVVGLVVWSVVQVSGPMMESIFALVAEWIPSKRHGQAVRTLLDGVRYLTGMA